MPVLFGAASHKWYYLTLHFLPPPPPGMVDTLFNAHTGFQTLTSAVILYALTRAA